MSTGYYIEDAPDGSNRERVKLYGQVRFVHWPLFDGPIEAWQKDPDFIVTPFELPDKEEEAC